MPGRGLMECRAFTEGYLVVDRAADDGVDKIGFALVFKDMDLDERVYRSGDIRLADSRELCEIVPGRFRPEHRRRLRDTRGLGWQHAEPSSDRAADPVRAEVKHPRRIFGVSGRPLLGEFDEKFTQEEGIAPGGSMAGRAEGILGSGQATPDQIGGGCR